MIAKHSLEESDAGDGVEIVKNEECEDPVHGKGQFTEKHIHISKWVGILVHATKLFSGMSTILVILSWHLQYYFSPS